MRNRHVKFSWKIPNRFGKIATRPQGGGIFFDSHCTCMWDWEGTLLDPSMGRGSALSSKILDFEKTYFCRLFSAKIYLYNQKMPKWPYTWDAILHGSWRWTCDDNNKQTIHWQWMIWARGLQRPRPQLRWNLLELGGSFKWARGFIPQSPWQFEHWQVHTEKAQQTATNFKVSCTAADETLLDDGVILRV